MDGLPQYLPVTPSISPNPRRMGILAPSAKTTSVYLQLRAFSLRNSLPGGFGGCEPTILPMSVETQPGQQAFMIRPGFSRARIAVSALIHALLTLYDCCGNPAWLSVPLLADSCPSMSPQAARYGKASVLDTPALILRGRLESSWSFESAAGYSCCIDSGTNQLKTH